MGFILDVRKYTRGYMLSTDVEMESNERCAGRGGTTEGNRTIGAILAHNFTTDDSGRDEHLFGWSAGRHLMRHPTGTD